MPEQTYRTLIEKIARTHSSSVSVFADFCQISACALAAGTREKEYLETIKSYSKEELQQLTEAFALMVNEAEANPFSDILGPYYLEIAAHSSKQARGDFYTPECISELMARIAFNPEKTITNGSPISVYEPACGAGGMVLAIAKLFSPLTQGGEKSYLDLLRVTCQDINPVATDMCFINTTLWGIPSKIILGNFLDPDLSSQKAWRNIHWFRVGEEERLNIKALFELLRSEEDPPKKSPTENQVDLKPDPETEQGLFDFDLGEMTPSTEISK